MKYTPTYFDFDSLAHKGEVLEVFLLVVFVYIVILVMSWLYARFGP